MRQYLPNKHHKWDFKFFVLCGVSGFANNLELYSGQENDEIKRHDCETDLGASLNVVVRLCRVVPNPEDPLPLTTTSFALVCIRLASWPLSFVCFMTYDILMRTNKFETGLCLVINCQMILATDLPGFVRYNSMQVGVSAR